MRFEPPDELLADHDVLLIGYRGVDGSSVLDCPEYSKATLGDGKDVFSDKSLALMSEAIRTCRVRMEAAGLDLSGYTIPAVVEDAKFEATALGPLAVLPSRQRLGIGSQLVRAGLETCRKLGE